MQLHHRTARNGKPKQQKSGERNSGSTARMGGFIFSVSEAEEDDLLMLIAVFFLLVVETSGTTTTENGRKPPQASELTIVN